MDTSMKKALTWIKRYTHIYIYIYIYIEQSCLFVGMAGTGKSKILLDMQRTLLRNGVSKSFVTACPTHETYKIVNCVTLHRLSNVNPIDYSYEYKKVTS